MQQWCQNRRPTRRLTCFATLPVARADTRTIFLPKGAVQEPIRAVSDGYVASDLLICNFIAVGNDGNRVLPYGRH